MNKLNKLIEDFIQLTKAQIEFMLAHPIVCFGLPLTVFVVGILVMRIIDRRRRR